jgi:hypothetical protein
MLPRGATVPAALPEGFDLVKQMKVLGHVVAHDGSIRPCWEEGKKALWRSFWRNSGCRKARAIGTSERLDLLARATLPALSFRVSRWPPQKQIGLELDAVQRRMIAVCLKIRLQRHETLAAYVRRRNREISAVTRKCGEWSRMWWSRAAKWDDHLHRHPESPASIIASCHGPNWLLSLRAVWATISTNNPRAWSVTAGRTDTRVCAGRPQPRWRESISAFGVELDADAWPGMRRSNTS